MKSSLLLFFLFCSLSLSAQPADLPRDENAIPEVVDSLYREDQFYVGLSFNLITNEPATFSQNGFSGGLHAGFIRDMPVNKRRNLALGVGLGLSTNTYNSNLLIEETDAGMQYSIIENVQQNTNANRFNTNLIEVPIQLRWRTSTPTSYNFWRVYGGVKLGYLFYFKSVFKDDARTVRTTNINTINQMRYHATLSIGNGSFNAFVNYSLTPLFNSTAVTDNGSTVDLQPIKFGIEFYLL